MNRWSWAGLLVPICLIWQIPANSHAQNYPAKPVRYLIPSTGGTEVVGRLVAQGMTHVLGQQVFVDPRTGAAGNLGAEIAARAPADGYTIVIAVVGPWAIHPYLYKLPYDVLKDFAPIIHVATTPGALVVHPSVPAKTVNELIALARQKPGALNYGSAGVGGFFHISAELFAFMTRIRMTHVPYKGPAAALTDLVGGHRAIRRGELHRHRRHAGAVSRLPEIGTRQVQQADQGSGHQGGGRAFTVCGEPGPDGKSVKLWATDDQNALALSVSADLR